MGFGEIKDIEIASTDLYTEVKLRTSNAKRCHTTKNVHIESSVSTFSKFRKNKSARHISAITDAKEEKNHRLMWLLEDTKGKKYNQTRERGSRPPVTIEDPNISSEEIALEMLMLMSKKKSMTSSLGHRHGFNYGELVWGKIESHPWWPGQIYDESKATLSVNLSKQKGCVLVAFFGDNTYGWLNPKNIIRFEPHFEEKSKRSKDLVFLKAVKEALIEIKKRSALGLTCKCSKSSTLESTYPVDQIKNGVNGFNGDEVLNFLQELALRPNFDVHKNVGKMKNAGRLIGFRNAVCEVSDVEDHMDDDVSYGRKKAHDQAGLPLEESKSRDQFKKDKLAKQVNLKYPKAEMKNTKSREKPLRKRSLQDISEKDFPNKGKKYSFDNDNEKTMLVIKFPPRERLPSVSELKAKFARFGPFYESAIRIFWKSSTCEVVFVCRSKAQGAYDHGVQNRALFGKSQANYFLQALEGSVSEKLPEGGKSKVSSIQEPPNRPYGSSCSRKSTP